MPMMKCHLSPFVRTINKTGLVLSPVGTVVMTAAGQIDVTSEFGSWLTVGVALFLGWLMGMTLAAAILFVYQLEEGRQPKAEAEWKRKFVYGGLTRAQFEAECGRRQLNNLALHGVEGAVGD